MEVIIKINAYILASDPAWIEASVLSYYDYVERIVVSYDKDGRGWTGLPDSSEQCLRRLRKMDKAGKCDYRPGHFSRSECFRTPMVNETHQRQVALDQASEGSRWVLQLDTDEVVGNVGLFCDCLAEADRLGRSALNYPSIWLYNQAAGRYYLEWCRRGWRRSVGYPGPMAVTAGSKLAHARRVADMPFHVDITRTPSRGAVPHSVKVDRMIRASDAIWHFSMVRSETYMRQKLASFGHAYERDWNREITRWLRAQAHPLILAFLTQFERGRYNRPLKFALIPPQVNALLRLSHSEPNRPIANSQSAGWA